MRAPSQSLTTPAASPLLSGESTLALESFSHLASEYRDSFNARMRQKMTLAFAGITLFLTLMVAGVYSFGWFKGLFAFMEHHSEIEDPLVFLFGCLLVGIVAVMVIYIQEVHHL